MNLNVSYSQTSVSAQFQYSNAGQTSNNATVDAPKEHHRRHRVNSDDQVTLSQEARKAHKVRHEHEDHDRDPMSALDKLVSQFVRTMLKTMVGQDFNLKEPGQGNAQGQPQGQLPAPASATPAVAAPQTPAAVTPPADATGATPAVPATTAPEPGKPPVTGPYANAVAAYYQVQSFSFDFSSTVKTEDGQQMGVSVHFSFSQSFYAAVGTAANPAANAPKPADNAEAVKPPAEKPVAQPFQGVAAQLTQTSFQFEVDFNGAPAEETPAATTTPSTPTSTDQPAPAANVPAPVTAAVAKPEDDNPLLEQLDKLFERLQVWLKDAEGGRQLVAVGINRTTAMYVGNLVESTGPTNAQPETQPAADAGTPADQEPQAVNVVA